MHEPKRPSQLSDYAIRTLEALAAEGLGHQKAGSEIDQNRALLAVQTHLTRIERHRPLEAIAETDQHGEAAQVRSWFSEVFLDAAFLD